jgi:hypothetical protein
MSEERLALLFLEIGFMVLYIIISGGVPCTSRDGNCKEIRMMNESHA